MNQLERDLTDLLAAKADATTITSPPLDAIVAEGRAATARRNRTIGLVAAAAVAAVVAAIAIPVGILHADRSAPVGPIDTPSHHPSTSTNQTEARQIIADGRPYQAAESPTGEIATIWGKVGGTGSDPNLAWQVIEPGSGEKLVGLVPGDDQSNVALTATGDGFLLTDPQSSWHGAELDFVGHVTPLRRVGRLTMGPGRVLVAGWRGEEMVDPKTGTWAPALDGNGRRLGDGTTLAETEWAETTVSGKLAITRRTDDGPWSTSILPGNAIGGTSDLAAAGSRVAVALYGDHGTGTNSRPVAALDVSQDGGTTWTSTPVSALPFDEIYGIASTDDGTLFVDALNAGFHSELFRSTDASWTHFVRVTGVGQVYAYQLMPPLQQLQPPVGGNRVLALSSGGSTGTRLVAIADDGTMRTLEEFGANDATSPAVAYLHGGFLHVDGVSIPTKANYLEEAGGTVMVGRWTQTGIYWRVLRHDTLVRAPWAGDGNIWLSPDGGAVATVSWPNHRYARITAADPATGTILGSTDVSAPWISCCGGGQNVELQSVDASHQVFFIWNNPTTNYETDYYMWQAPSSPEAAQTRPVRVHGLRAQSRATPGGPTFGPLGPVTAKGYQHVDSRGQLSHRPLATLPAMALDATDVWSPNLRVLAYGDIRGGTPGIYDLDTGASRALGVPSDTTEANVETFSGNRTVLVDAYNTRGRTWLLSCSVSGSPCRRLLDLGLHPGSWTFGTIPW